MLRYLDPVKNISKHLNRHLEEYLLKVSIYTISLRKNAASTRVNKSREETEKAG